MHATTIGVDLAKSVFQVSIANQADRIISRKRLTRSQFERFVAQQAPSKVVMEACATSNYWSKFAQAHGHDTRLLHAFYVRPYVRRNKTDAADADALIRANKDPQLISIPTKSDDQLALQLLHRCRQQLMETKIARINLVRGALAEFGVSLPRGVGGIERKLRVATEDVPELLRPALNDMVTDLVNVKDKITGLDQYLKTIAMNNAPCKHMMSIPGVGVTIATAMYGTVANIHAFASGRKFSSWLGITPREYSSGSTQRIGRISKQGNRYLRTLLVHGARAALLQAHRLASRDPGQLSELQRWVIKLEETRPRNVATLGLANKMARILWSTWTQERDYQE